MLQKIVLLCLGLAASAMAQADCTPQSLERLNQATRSALTELQAVKEEGEEGGDTVVSPAASEQLHKYKDALVKGIDGHLSCSPTDSDDVSLQQTLLPMITLPAQAPESGFYGAEPGFDVTRQPEFPDIVLIRSGFAIPCGDDNVLLAYQRREGKWNRILRWQSEDYKTISGAFGDNVTYHLIPSSQQAAPPRLVVAQGTPWCTSRWSVFQLNLIELATQSAEQRSLFHTRESYIRFTDDDTSALRVKTTPLGFEVRAVVGMLDSDVLMRQGIFRYRINGERVERVQPAAMNGRDFVDEWLQVDDETASRWSQPPAAGALAEQHQLLKNRYGNYGAVRLCKGKPERYQVEMLFSARDASHAKPALVEQQAYFMIKPIVGGFMMESVSTQPDAECAGKDIMLGQ